VGGLDWCQNALGRQVAVGKIERHYGGIIAIIPFLIFLFVKQSSLVKKFARAEEKQIPF
jgi:hypothetical protein